MRISLAARDEPAVTVFYWSGWSRPLAHPEGRSYQNHAVASDKQHGDVPLGGLQQVHKSTRKTTSSIPSIQGMSQDGGNMQN